jgi:hypothetical protein
MTTVDEPHEPNELQHPSHAPSILGIALGCATYAAAHRFGRAFFEYLPETGEWVVRAPPGHVSITYFGMIPYGLLGFVAGWAIAKIPGLGARLGSHGARMLTVTATVAIAGALLYHLGIELTGHTES